MMDPLKVYKRMPEWTEATLPDGFRRKHRTKEGTWGQLTVRAGSLRFIHLDAGGAETSSVVLAPASEPLLVEPGAWHRVEPLDSGLVCQLAFLCTPERFMEKKHGLTAPHSEVRALLPQLQPAGGRTVLDLGSGRGRNSFFLASKGFEVTAVDRSETAIATLGELATEESYAVTSHVYDINTADLGEVLGDQPVDHVVSTVVFQFLEASRVPAIIANLQTVTRPAGLHLIVAPVTSRDIPCPIPFSFVFQRGELRDYYRHWDVLRYEEALGEFHKRDANGDRYKAEFATLVARKRGPDV